MWNSSLQDADDLIAKGHELWKRGDISGAFIYQDIALRIKRQIERDCDYEIVLTSEGLRVQQKRSQDEAERLYKEYLTKFQE